MDINPPLPSNLPLPPNKWITLSKPKHVTPLLVAKITPPSNFLKPNYYYLLYYT
jgi:hypothetical protein